MDKLDNKESFPITSKSRKSKSREVQEMDCLLLETVPIVLTQFEPTARVSQDRQDEWIKFMKFVDKLLVEAKAHEFIVVDKKHQVSSTDRLQYLLPENEKSNPQAYRKFNTDIAYILRDLQDNNHPIFKKEITRRLNEETIDKLTLREEVIEVYLNVYEMFNDFDKARTQTIEVMRRRLSK